MSNPKMSEEERMALAKKMDEDIDNFMETLAANQSTKEKKEFDLEAFFEEIDNHPAFMKGFKEGGLSEHLGALQSMKYDTEGEDVMETANNHKDAGNKHFKFKKYRWAIQEYTEGIKLKVPECQFNAVLYNNRATCQKYLGNHRAAFKDCRIALRFDPTYIKAIIRLSEIIDSFTPEASTLTIVAKSVIDTVKNSELTEDQRTAVSAAVSKIIKRAVQLTKTEDARKQKANVEMFADNFKKEVLLKKLKQRGLSFWPRFDFNDYKSFEWEDLAVNMPGMSELQCVYYDAEENSLNWPVLLQYPETQNADSLINCPDIADIESIFAAPFEHPHRWDPDHRFNLSNIRLFLEIDAIEEETVVEVFLNQTLREALATNGYVVKRGLPVFMIYTKDHIDDLVEPIKGRTNWYRLK